MKLSDLRNAAGGVDMRNIPVSLAVVALLPFLACLVIIVLTPGIERRLLVHSIVVAAVLWAIGGATCAAFQYLDDREGAGRNAAVRSLLWVAGLLLPMAAAVAILGRL